MRAWKWLIVLAAAGLPGCNVVPPLDCLMGVERPGCHRDANGMYRYLYTSPLLPAPNPDAVPVGFAPAAVAPPRRVPTNTTCFRNGPMVNCTTY